jgi:hypothetical protein
MKAVIRLAAAIDGQRYAVVARERGKARSGTGERHRGVGSHIGGILRLRKIAVVERARIEVIEPFRACGGACSEQQRSARESTRQSRRECSCNNAVLPRVSARNLQEQEPKAHQGASAEDREQGGNNGDVIAKD